MKHLLTLVSFAIIATLFVPLLAKAEVVHLPGIYVKDISLDNTTYKEGDTVKGTFNFLNTENYAVSNIYYSVLLMGDYRDTIPHSQYDRTAFIGPFNLSANEKKSVSFSYTIPEGINGDGLGIQIHAAMQNGTGLGWNDSMIKVTGSTKLLKFVKGDIEVGKNNFGFQEGPMVYSGDKIYLNVTLHNPSASAISFVPSVDIYNRSITGELLKNFSEGTTTVKANTNASIKIELPTFGFDPKVYVGSLNLTDAKGIRVAPSLDFRYVVYGDIVTINQVSVDRESVQKGDSLVVTVDYSGAPFDVLNSKRATSSPADLSINIFNEDNKLVGSYAGKEDFNIKTQSILNISAGEDAKTLRVEVVASKDGKVLAKYITTFSGDLAKGKTPSFFSKYINIKDISIVIIAILSLGTLIFVRKLSEKKILLLGLVVLIIVFWFVFMITNGARAWVQDSYTTTGNGTIDTANLIVNSPSGSYTPGQQYYFQVSASANACGNYGMTFTVSSGGYSASLTRGQECTTNCPEYSGVAYPWPALTFSAQSLGPFTASTTPGTYSQHANLRVSEYDNSNTANLNLHQDYNVLYPTPGIPTNVTAIASSTCSGGINISWSPSTNAAGYSLYRWKAYRLQGGTLDGNIANVSSTSYTDTTATPGVLYEYLLKAYNPNLTSPYVATSDWSASSTQNGATATAPAGCSIGSVKPTSPQAITPVINGQCGSISLSWPTVNYATYYKVFRDGNLSQPILSYVNGTSTMDTGLIQSAYSSVPMPTGGTITTSGSSRIHTFTSGGIFTVPTGVSGNVKVLAVGGGAGVGGGLVNVTWNAGGGGGQVVSSSSFPISAGTSSVVIGNGGGPSSNGGNSSFGALTALHGNTGYSTAHGGASGSGYAGGAWTGSGNGAGGGGGAGGAGSSNSGNTGGAGGVGIASSISGASVTYGSGGKGGDSSTSVNAGSNTGNGGGGANGSGGSGVVIISYVPGVDIVPSGWHSYSVQAFNDLGSSAISDFSAATSSSATCLTPISSLSCAAFKNGSQVSWVTAPSSVTWKVTNLVGGVAPYTYGWSGLGVVNTNSSSTTASYSSSTNFTATTTILASYGSGVQAATSSASCSINVWASSTPLTGLTINFSQGTPLLYVNRPTTITVTVPASLGLDPNSLQISWSTTPSVAGEFSTSSSATKIFTTVGTQTIYVNVKGQKADTGEPFETLPSYSYSAPVDILLPQAPNTEQ
jgi:hypothetical protein